MAAVIIAMGRKGSSAPSRAPVKDYEMKGEFKPSTISYVNLLWDERAKLEAKESQIATLLMTDLGFEGEACWIATEDSRHRTIRLMIPGETPQMVFELSEIELAELPAGELLDELRHAIRRA